MLKTLQEIIQRFKFTLRWKRCFQKTGWSWRKECGRKTRQEGKGCFKGWGVKDGWQEPHSGFGSELGMTGKESACNVGDLGSIPGLGRSPWRRERLPTPVFWLGEFHGVAKSQTRLSELHFGSDWEAGTDREKVWEMGVGFLYSWEQDGGLVREQAFQKDTTLWLPSLQASGTSFTRMPPMSFHPLWQLPRRRRTLKFVARHRFRICLEESILSITFTFWENQSDSRWGPNQI